MKRDVDDRLKDDASVDEGHEAAWDAEIARRIRDVEAGRVAPFPWTEVRRRLVDR
jgi:putative addiction module component (TIGR02574 family)